MSIRSRLALMICPELARETAPNGRDDALEAIQEDYLTFDEARDYARRAAHPCLMQAHGPGHHNAYCVRCGETVNVALPEACPALAPTREELGLERAEFLDLDAARSNLREFKAAGKQMRAKRRAARPPLRQFPRVMIPFEAIRRCTDAVRFPTLSAGPELEKWLSQHVERLAGIPCPSRLQRAQLDAARWLTEAPEPEFEAIEGAPEDGPALSGDDAELSALLQGRPELDEADARRALERLGQKFPTLHGEPRPSHDGRVHRISRGVR